jgi:hypothetical protein
MMRLTADNIKIDDDEGRFILMIDTEEAGKLTVDFHACALEFEDEVRRQLRPYALEAAHGRATLVSAYDAAEAYGLDDPKSNGWHDRMVSAWDEREGK